MVHGREERRDGAGREALRGPGGAGSSFHLASGYFYIQHGHEMDSLHIA